MNKKTIILPLVVLLSSCSNGEMNGLKQIKKVVDSVCSYQVTDGSNATSVISGSLSFEEANILYKNNAFIVYKDKSGSADIYSLYLSKRVYSFKNNNPDNLSFSDGAYSSDAPANIVVKDSILKTTFVIDELGNILFDGETKNAPNIYVQYVKSLNTSLICSYKTNIVTDATYQKYSEDYSSIVNLSDNEEKEIRNLFGNKDYYMPSSVTVIPSTQGSRFYKLSNNVLSIYDSKAKVLSTLDVPSDAIAKGFIGKNYVYQLKRQEDTYAEKYDFLESGIKYNLYTYKYDVESGTLSEVDFNYQLDSSYIYSLSATTMPCNDYTVLGAREIKNHAIESMMSYVTDSSMKMTRIPLFDGTSTYDVSARVLSNGIYYNPYNSVFYDKDLNRLNSFEGFSINSIDTKKDIVFGTLNSNYCFYNLDGKRISSPDDLTNFISSGNGNYYFYSSNKITRIALDDSKMITKESKITSVAYSLGSNLFAIDGSSANKYYVYDANENKVLTEIQTSSSQISSNFRAVCSYKGFFTNSLSYKVVGTSNVMYVTFHSGKTVIPKTSL